MTPDDKGKGKGKGKGGIIDFLSPPLTKSVATVTATNPPHYKQESTKVDRRPMSSMEAIDVIEKFNLDFSLGNAIKYILRAGRKDPLKEIEDLEKAHTYIQRRINTLQGRPSWSKRRRS